MKAFAYIWIHTEIKKKSDAAKADVSARRICLKLGIHMHVCECVCGYDKNQNSKIHNALIHMHGYECVGACECESDFFNRVAIFNADG